MSIRTNAFSGSSIKSSLTIPSGVDSIGESSFKDCSSLVSLIIECDAEIIKEAFYCYRVNNHLRWVLSKAANNLKTLNIDTTQTATIGNRAFYDCLIESDLILPNKLARVVKSAFEISHISALQL